MPPALVDNLPLRRWPAARPQYENWYALVNHPSRRCCYWFRYTLLSTTTGVREARIWAIPVDAARPGTRVVTLPLPQDAFRAEAGTLRFGDQGLLTPQRLTGSVRDAQGRIEWDLAFPPSPGTVHALEPGWARQLVSKTSQRSPFSSVRVQGWVSVDGERVELQDASAHQGHTEGPRMQDQWVWGRAGAFENQPDAWFEGATARKAGRNLATFSVHAQGRRFALNHLLNLKSNQVDWQLGQWNLAGRTGGFRVQATVNATAQEPVKVRYLDTDGRPKFNCMFPMASCAVSISPSLDGKTPATTLLCKGQANVEFVGPVPLHGQESDFQPVFGN